MKDFQTHVFALAIGVASLTSAAAQTQGAEADQDQSARSPARFLANVTALSSDHFGGRAPMSDGERLTLDFIEGRFKEAGLEPMFDDSYRQPVEPDWDMRGTFEDIHLYFEIGSKIANSESWPKWSEGNEFRAIREQSRVESP